MPGREGSDTLACTALSQPYNANYFLYARRYRDFGENLQESIIILDERDNIKFSITRRQFGSDEHYYYRGGDCRKDRKDLHGVLMVIVLLTFVQCSMAFQKSL